MTDTKPRIFVFCNSCSPEWHSFVALAEDGAALCGHVCSDHGFGPGDMGVTTTNKHEHYAEHYPGGFEVEYAETRGKADANAHPGLAAAIAKAVLRG